MSSVHRRLASSRFLPSMRTLGHLAPGRRARRKAIDVERLRRKVNRLLADETPWAEHNSPEARAGLCFVLEKALTWAQCYRGYLHLPSAGRVSHPDTGTITAGDPTRRYYL